MSLICFPFYWGLETGPGAPEPCCVACAGMRKWNKAPVSRCRLLAGALCQTPPHPGQAATGPSPRLALWWLSYPSPCMPVGLLWCTKVSGRNVCLLILANKCHPAKASGHPLAFSSSVLLGRGPWKAVGRGEAGSRFTGSEWPVLSAAWLGLRMQVILTTVCSLVVVAGSSGL